MKQDRGWQETLVWKQDPQKKHSYLRSFSDYICICFTPPHDDDFWALFSPVPPRTHPEREESLIKSTQFEAAHQWPCPSTMSGTSMGQHANIP